MKLLRTPILTAVFLSAFGIFALSPAAYAEKTKSPEAQAEKRLEFFKTTIGITDDQVDAVQAILLDEATKRAAIPRDLPQEEKKEKIKELKKEVQDSLNTVLTAEQKAKLKESKAKPNKD